MSTIPVVQFVLPAVLLLGEEDARAQSTDVQASPPSEGAAENRESSSLCPASECEAPPPTARPVAVARVVTGLTGHDACCDAKAVRHIHFISFIECLGEIQQSCVRNLHSPGYPRRTHKGNRLVCKINVSDPDPACTVAPRELHP
jgi:hypothetical protein